jgi:hypothetical protein
VVERDAREPQHVVRQIEGEKRYQPHEGDETPTLSARCGKRVPSPRLSDSAVDGADLMLISATAMVDDEIGIYPHLRGMRRTYERDELVLFAEPSRHRTLLVEDRSPSRCCSRLYLPAAAKAR